MNRWRALAACWLLTLASCASDGGQRGTGITIAEGNVSSVQANGPAGIGGIQVSVEGTELRTTTDADGGFALQGDFAGDTALRFERALDAVSARLPVSAPAGGRLGLHDVVLDVGNGSARADRIEVSFEGVVDALACDDARITLRSIHRAADDLETYVVVLTGSMLHDGEGHPLACTDLDVGDRLDVHGFFVSDGTIANADLTRR
jgi:hypothetical protein